MVMQPLEIQRKDGYYWVRLFGDHWDIAKYGSDDDGKEPVWYMPGNSVPFCRDDFEEIGDEISPRGYDHHVTRTNRELIEMSNRAAWQYKKLLFWNIVASITFGLSFIAALLNFFKLI